MSPRRLIDYVDRALWGWRLWRMRRERERAMPELRAIRLTKETCQRQHKKGTVAAEKAASAAVHANMRGVA